MRLIWASLTSALLLVVAGAAHAQHSSPLGTDARRLETITAIKQAAEKTAVDADVIFGERFSFTTGAVTGCDWSPDGRWIAYEENGDIFIAPTGGGSPVNLTADMAGLCYLPVFAPDNSGVMYTVYNSDASRQYVNFSDITGLMSVEILDNAFGGVVSHNGRFTVYRDFISYDLRIYDNQTQSRKTLVSDKLRDSNVAGLGMACFPPDDSHVIASVVVNGRQRLFRFSLDGAEKTQLTFNGGDHDYPDISPDGRWLLFSDMTVADTQVNRQLARELSTGRTVPVLPDTDVNTYMGRFSPSGDEFCYLLNVADESYEVYIADFDPPEPGVQHEIVMAPIPGGTFQMGSERFTTSIPIHTVTISPFEMSNTEITQGQYEAIMSTNPSSYKGDLARPVETLSWQDAVTFCNRLSISQGLEPCYNLKTWICDFTKNGFRLPTEAEWEYACRAGTNSRFYSGDTEKDLDAVAWYKGNSGGTHHPVAKKAPNSFGLYDMHGNVQEWVNDWWSEYTTARVTDPTGPETGPYTINRGGYYDHEPLYLDSTIRNSGIDRVNPLGPYTGFRVVRREAQTPATVNLISPNGGEILVAGTSHYIAWTSSGVTLVKLEYSTDNGVTWKLIADNVQASVEGYSWEVPASATASAMVRISGISTSSTVTQPVIDKSDRVFTIAVPHLRVAAPNGGETWNIGSSQTIRWTSAGVGDLKIEFSPDNGSTWTVIKDRVDASLGQYLWPIPDMAVSSSCLIRVSDAYNPALNDTSDAAFSVARQAFIQVTSPAEGDAWVEDSTHEITWTASGVEKVDIEYTANGGISWIIAATNVSASAGAYQWRVPQVESSNCSVRVFETNNQEVGASSGVFSILTSDYITVMAPVGGDSWSVNTQKEIRWEGRGVPLVRIEISYDGGYSWTEVIADNLNAYAGYFMWTVPDNQSNQCKIKVSDVSRPDVVTFTTDTFSIVRPEIAIAHTPRTNARENEAIIFEATVSATADIQSVVLNYNRMGQSEGVFSIPMQQGDNNRWTYTLGAGFFVAPGIEYYIIATDISGTTARSPVDAGVHAINARVVDMHSTQVVSGGSEQTSYRMISIPLNLTATSIAEQMKQTLPSGSMTTDWRLFRYPPGGTAPVEYPNSEAFAPGRAFWIITKNSFTLKAPEGTTVTTEEPFQMTLKSGWNDIANPWMFNIYWNDIDNRSSAQLSALYTYNGSWSDPTSPPAVLEPWKGYAVRNMESSDRIIFMRTGGMMGKHASPVIADSWRVSIRASAGEALDFANHFGVRTDACEEWDRNDHVEPPSVGGYVSVSFPHYDWSVFPCEYTVDYRPPSETLSWDFVVRTNIPGETVDVGFDGFSKLPEDAVLTLIDSDHGGTIDLSGAGFSFMSGDGVTERHFTIVVSSDSYLPPGPTSENPSEFITAAAYPNPFNPQTTLRYEMPSAGKVRITIYNTLGQPVREYYRGYVQAGVHEQVFDASGLTSGLYFYRIDAGYSAVTGKALYMK